MPALALPQAGLSRCVAEAAPPFSFDDFGVQSAIARDLAAVFRLDAREQAASFRMRCEYPSRVGVPLSQSKNSGEPFPGQSNDPLVWVTALPLVRACVPSGQRFRDHRKPGLRNRGSGLGDRRSPWPKPGTQAVRSTAARLSIVLRTRETDPSAGTGGRGPGRRIGVAKSS